MKITFIQDRDLDMLRWHEEFPFSKGDYRLERGYAEIQDDQLNVQYVMIVADGKKRYKIYADSKTPQIVPARIIYATPFDRSFALERHVELELFEYLKKGHEAGLLDDSQFLTYSRKIDMIPSEINDKIRNRNWVPLGIGSASLVASAGMSVYYIARTFNVPLDQDTSFYTSLISAATAGFLRNAFALRNVRLEIKKETESTALEMHNLLRDLESRLKT